MPGSLVDRGCGVVVVIVGTAAPARSGTRNKGVGLFVVGIARSDGDGL
jgi:hypothetical protein